MMSSRRRIRQDASSAVFISSLQVKEPEMSINPQAEKLNETIRTENPHVFDLLSRRGRDIYFPRLGILSQSADATGKNINATIGTALEDDGTPMCLSSIAGRVNMEPGKIFNYAPSFGRPEIRSAWKTMLAEKNPSIDASRISLPIVTSALTHGISVAAYLFVNEGDQVILPDLYWENYELIFGNACGGKLNTFQMFDGKGGFNVDGLSGRIFSGSRGKKIVLLNFPNNPTGYTITSDEAVRIRDMLVKAADDGNDILALVDDAYFGLVFEEGILTESMFSFLAHAHPRILAVKFDGPTKEDYVWGFRVGFVTFASAQGSPALYSALEAKLAGAIRGNISNASNLSQSLLLAAWSDAGYDAQKTEKYDILKRRYQKIRKLLQEHPEYVKQFSALPFNSGYFMCVRLENGNAEQVRQKLLTDYDTGIIAMGDVMRIAFSSTPFDKLEILFENIFRASQDVSPVK
jgi:aspartate/methionine/tyrosine aminotransferase